MRSVDQQLGGTVYTGFPGSTEDRNGNVIKITEGSGGAFNYIDTLGRTVLSSSGFGATSNTVTVSGLTNPYTIVLLAYNFRDFICLANQGHRVTEMTVPSFNFLQRSSLSSWRRGSVIIFLPEPMRSALLRAVFDRVWPFSILGWVRDVKR